MRYDLDQLRQGMAVVYQDFARFALPVRENIRAGMSIDSDAELQEALRWSGADEVVAKLASGLDTELTHRFEGGVDLSGGEWQKLALARAALRDAALVILDEPTSALDAEAEQALFMRFRDLLGGRTGLLISHRFSTVRMADQIIVLEQGRILEAGSHAELIARAGRYAELYDMQASRYRDDEGERVNG